MCLDVTVIGFTGIGNLCGRIAEQLERFYRGEHGDFGLDRLGKRQHLINGVFGQRRTINWSQNVRVHGKYSSLRWIFQGLIPTRT